MMVRMRRTIWAIVANDVVAGVAFVGVCFDCVAAFCEFEGGFGDDLVEGEGAAGESFAGVAVAEDVTLLFAFERDFPLSLAAVAFSSICRHVV